jgi:hypothetical protein
MWYDMIWYDTIRYDMIRYDMIWYDMIYDIWYDMIWYDIMYMIYDMIWYDTIRYDMIYDVIWYDIWYDMIWYDIWYDMIWYDMIYLLTAIGLTPGGSSTVHIYTQTIHRTTQLTTLVGRLYGIWTQSAQTKVNDELPAAQLSPNWEECVPCPIFGSYTLAFALQLRKKRG